MRIVLLFILPFLWVSCKSKTEEASTSKRPGTTRHIHSFESNNIGSRALDIWLPGNFDPQKKYAVIYMQDGQMLFDSAKTWNKLEWHVDETMQALMDQQKIKDAIVVGIANSEFRNAEFLPQAIFKGLPTAVRIDLEKNYLKSSPRSNDYLRFIVEELKTYIDASYPTHPDPAHTFIMGSSKGGLISLYAICEYPQIFGGAACLSTDWILTEPDLYAKQSFDLPATVRDYLSNNLPEPKGHKIYFDYGTATRDSLYKPHQLMVDSIMRAHGYTDQNWMTKEFEGDEHSETAWSKRLHIPLEFLLGIETK